jgi:pimeloyl-ACP methyl ester carboxylesterase
MAFAKKLLNTSLIIGGALGAMAFYNKTTETLAGEIDTVLTGEQRRYPWKYGDMFYEVKGAQDARPLLLIHSFWPGASSFEWRKNVDVLAEHFRVYTLDLLGFGLSDRPAINYDAELYTDLLNDFIKEVIGKPTVVVAHGLTCAYIIACAFRRPQFFERLVLVSPPTTILEDHLPDPLHATWKFLLHTPVLGQFIYNQLTSRQAIRRYYDKLGYQDLGLLTDDLVEYIFTSAHQPDSRYPAAASLNGYLTLNVHEPLAHLQVPVVAVWGREEMLIPDEIIAAFQRVNPRIETRIFDKSRFHLQEEQAVNFNNFMRDLASTTVS